MKKPLLILLLLCGAFAGIHAQVITSYNSSLTNTSPTFNRPDANTPPTTLSGTGTAVYYQVITITVPATGTYVITGASLYDNFGVLYNANGFNPASPLTNAIAADDNTAVTNFQITQTLNAGTYYLVFTTAANGDNGLFSVAVAGVSGVVLPLKLLTFDARKTTGTQATINWTTAAEQGVDYFQVEKSTDGSNFSPLQKVAAQANEVSGAHEYSVTDNALSGSRNFYRLKMVDLSGAFTYSNTRMIACDGMTTYASVYPNPAVKTASLSYVATEAGQINILIADMTGRTMWQKTCQVNQGGNEVPLDLSGLPAATYVVNWSAAADKGTLKLQKR